MSAKDPASERKPLDRVARSGLRGARSRCFPFCTLFYPAAEPGTSPTPHIFQAAAGSALPPSSPRRRPSRSRSPELLRGRRSAVGGRRAPSAGPEAELQRRLSRGSAPASQPPGPGALRSPPPPPQLLSAGSEATAGRGSPGVGNEAEEPQGRGSALGTGNSSTNIGKKKKKRTEPKPSPHGQPRLHPAHRRRLRCCPPRAGSPAAAAPPGTSSPRCGTAPGQPGRRSRLSPRRTNRIPRGNRSRTRNRCPHSSGGGGGRANSRSPWPAAAPWLLPERAVIGRRPPRMQSSRGDDIPPHSARRSRRAAGRLHSSQRRRAPSGAPSGARRGPARCAAGGRAGRKAVLP